MICVWAFSFVMVDIAVEYISPLSIALYRLIIASFAFLLIDFFHKFYNKKVIKPPKNELSISQFSIKDWSFILLASLTGVALYLYFLYSAIEMIGPSLPALFLCLLSPIFISILALCFFNENINKIKFIGFIIASIGGFLLITGGNLENLSIKSPNFLGYIFALVTPIFWAIYATVTKKIANKKSDIEILKYTAYFGTIELLILVIINGEFIIFITHFMNTIVVICAIYLGLGCYTLGFFIWQSSQKKVKSSKVASFLYVEPFITLFFSFLLQRNEVIVIWNIIGGVIVLSAVIIINYK
jgi:drug/metabolite transporter (DMT)-like permease